MARSQNDRRREEALSGGWDMTELKDMPRWDPASLGRNVQMAQAKVISEAFRKVMSCKHCRGPLKTQQDLTDGECSVCRAIEVKK
jgi:hypothetical protein